MRSHFIWLHIPRKKFRKKHVRSWENEGEWCIPLFPSKIEKLLPPRTSRKALWMPVKRIFCLDYKLTVLITIFGPRITFKNKFAFICGSLGKCLQLDLVFSDLWVIVNTAPYCLTWEVAHLQSLLHSNTTNPASAVLIILSHETETNFVSGGSGVWTLKTKTTTGIAFGEVTLCRFIG